MDDFRFQVVNNSTPVTFKHCHVSVCVCVVMKATKTFIQTASGAERLIT